MVPRGFRQIAVPLFAFAVLVRAWITFSGYFYWDDFILSGRAARMGILDPDYLFYDHDGHLMPGGFALEWLVNKAAPLQFWLPALLMVLAQASIWWLWYRLITRTFGYRRLVLAPLLLMWFGPLVIPSGTWWAAALNGLPLQAAIVLGFSVVLRATMRPSTRSNVALVLVLVLGLIFFEKSVVLGPLLFGFAMVLGSGGWRERLASAYQSAAPAWLAIGVVTVAYLITYTMVSSRGVEAPASLSAAVSAFAIAIYTATLPTLVGGPLGWTPTGFAAALAHPPPWLAFLAFQIVAVIVGFTAWISARARWAWLWAWAYLIADIAFVVSGRLREGVSPEVFGALRYTSDFLPVAAIALGLALMPRKGEASDFSHERIAQVRNWWASWIPRYVKVMLVLFANVALIAALGSAATFRSIWRDNPAREYVRNATGALAAADPNVSLLAQPVPEFVLFPLANPYNQSDWVFGPLKGRPKFATYTSDLKVLGNTGELEAAHVEGPSSSLVGSAACRFKVSSSPVSIPLTGAVVDYEHTLEIKYLASIDSTIAISIGQGVPVDTHVAAGLGKLFVRLSGGGDTVSLSGLVPGATLCVDQVTVGIVKVGT